jgi:hypothetical protein
MGTENRANEFKAQDAMTGSSEPRERRVRASLTAEANAIRGRLPADITTGCDTVIGLNSEGTRQRRYEAATILGRTHPLTGLPPDPALATDLNHLCLALQEAVRVKRELAVERPGTISTTSVAVTDSKGRGIVFAPGTDRGITIVLSRRSIARSPRHEGGLTRYGTWLKPAASHQPPTCTPATSSSTAHLGGSVSTRWSTGET